MIALMQPAPSGPDEPTADPWSYRWDVTLTWLSPDTGLQYQTRRVVRTADELWDVVMHTSLDPRIVGYRYERRAELDLTAAPRRCTWCHTRYDPHGSGPSLGWRACSCEGHRVYACRTCGRAQLFPELNPRTCRNRSVRTA